MHRFLCRNANDQRYCHCSNSMVQYLRGTTTRRKPENWLHAVRAQCLHCNAIDRNNNNLIDGTVYKYIYLSQAIVNLQFHLDCNSAMKHSFIMCI